MMTQWEEGILRLMVKKSARKQKLLVMADRLISGTLKSAVKGESETIAFMFENELFEMWCDACGLSADTLRYAVKKIKGQL